MITGNKFFDDRIIGISKFFGFSTEVNTAITIAEEKEVQELLISQKNDFEANTRLADVLLERALIGVVHHQAVELALLALALVAKHDDVPMRQPLRHSLSHWLHYFRMQETI